MKFSYSRLGPFVSAAALVLYDCDFGLLKLLRLLGATLTMHPALLNPTGASTPFEHYRRAHVAT